MFDGGDGVLGVIGSIPPPPNTASWVDAKELDFGLIWPQHFHPVLLWIIANFRRAWTCAFLCRGTMRTPQVSLSLMIMIMIIWNSTRWDLAWNPSSRKIDSYFVFHPFVNNHTNCCHLLTKLLGDGLVTHSSLVKVYNLVPDILGQLFSLGRGGESGIWLIDCFCGQVVFYTGNNLRIGALPLRESS